MYFIKIRNTTSAIAPLVSLRNRSRQTLSRYLEFFKPVFSKTLTLKRLKIVAFQLLHEEFDKPGRRLTTNRLRLFVVGKHSRLLSSRLCQISFVIDRIEKGETGPGDAQWSRWKIPTMQPTETRAEEKRESECRFPFSSVGGAEKRRSVKALDKTWLKRWHVKS